MRAGAASAGGWAPSLLRRHLPADPAGHEYLVCGPPAMESATIATLPAAGVAPGDIRTDGHPAV